MIKKFCQQPVVLSFVFFVFLTALAADALAWGGRGHHTICEAASFLVKEKGLKDYLTSRPQMMGHLCNVPDFYWKSLGGEAGKLGNPTHFIDVEITGLKIQDIPTDYKKIIETYENQPNKFKEGSTIFNIPTEFGSAWWRADQFYRRATDLGPAWQAAALPSNSQEEQNETLVYNQSAYQFIVNLGLMGHFVGDMGQPFHSTADYDGYGQGHGGIHAYYEDAGVSSQSYKMTSKVVEQGFALQKLAAAKNKKQVPYLMPGSVIDRMKALTLVSTSEIAKIYSSDPILKKSEVKKEKGMEIKTAAERKPVAVVADKWGPMITMQLARSATLLALLWDEAYHKVGTPKLTAYKSYKYPFTPDFVAPDYHEIPTAKPEKK